MDKEQKEELASMSLGDHLEEMRIRLILAISGAAVGLIICLFFGKRFMQIIIRPYENAMAGAGLEPNMLAIHPNEQFMVYIKTSLVFGLMVAAPWIFYQVWKFVSSGLYKKERRFVRVVVPACATLFIAGAVFFIMVIAPITMTFFIGFDTGIEYVQSGTFTLSDYVNFVLSLTLIFGLAFQMPVAIVFAEMMNLVTIKALCSVRKYIVLVLVVVSAMVTPPDVISQIALAAPLYVLYEGSILFCRILRARKKKSKD